MTRDPIPSWYFVLVVVRHEDRFLLVHETKQGQAWYLPAGRVEPGETLEHAAIRETLEETRITIALDGVLRVEHTPMRMGLNPGSRVRVFYAAHPVGNTTPKRTPDEHSLEAAWVALADLPRLRLRGPDVTDVIQHLASGGTIYPLNLITYEGAPWQSLLPPSG